MSKKMDRYPFTGAELAEQASRVGGILSGMLQSAIRELRKRARKHRKEARAEQEEPERQARLARGARGGDDDDETGVVVPGKRSKR